MTTLLCDAYIPWLDHLLTGSDCEILNFQSPGELHEKLDRADALLIRTTTPVNESSFPKFPARLKAVATLTAGTDHIDENWVRQNGLLLISSPGCNAQSVAEYTATAVIHALEGDISELGNLTASIIGYGHTGKHTAALFRKLGITCVTCDPPLKESGYDFKHTPLQDALQSDIVTLHVPLTHSGAHPTANLLNFSILKQSSAQILINASRGGVLNEQDAITIKKNRALQKLVLDVWENEPNLNPESLQHADLATPHIAGYSLQGKFNASKMAVEQLGNLLGFKVNQAAPELPVPAVTDASKGLYWALQNVHTAFRLDRALRARPDDFAKLRNSHTLRMEFRHHRLAGLPEGEREAAKALGFSILT